MFLPSLYTRSFIAEPTPAVPVHHLVLTNASSPRDHISAHSISTYPQGFPLPQNPPLYQQGSRFPHHLNPRATSSYSSHSSNNLAYTPPRAPRREVHRPSSSPSTRLQSSRPLPSPHTHSPRQQYNSPSHHDNLKRPPHSYPTPQFTYAETSQLTWRKVPQFQCPSPLLEREGARRVVVLPPLHDSCRSFCLFPIPCPKRRL